MSKKKMKPVRRTPAVAAPRYLRELVAAESLVEQKRLPEARQALQNLALRYPGRYEILGALADVARDLNDFVLYERTLEQLARINPDDPELAAALAGAYLQNTWPVHALAAFRRVLERWPDYERADTIRAAIETLEEAVPGLLGSLGLTESDAFEIGLMHEEIQRLLHIGDYVQLRAVARKLLERRPNFTSALNNISLSYFAEGDKPQAIQTAERVLEIAPDNVHALGNLIRFQMLLGHTEAAKAYGERLKASQAPAAERQLKIVEALSYLGDDAGVLEVFERAQGDAEAESSLDIPLFHHLTAVAALRQGDEARAREHWSVALTLSSGFDLTLDNLADLERPVEERHAPWPFSLQYWIDRATIKDLAIRLEPVLHRDDTQGIRAVSQAFLRRHPELAGVVPGLLDRGDPQGRQFALMLAKAAETPEMLNALKEFALGRRGPDKMRIDAANFCADAGIMGTAEVPMWLHGDRHPILLLNFEIYSEPEGTLSEKAQALVERAHAKLMAGQPKEGEALLRQALEVEPESPVIQNNLAASLSMQGRNREFETMIHAIHDRYPDYFFGITNMAALALHRGDLKEAHAFLDPLLSMRRLHVTEFGALALIQIELLLAEGKPDGAESWIQLWEQVDPDNPSLARLRARAQAPARGGFFSRRKRR